MRGHMCKNEVIIEGCRILKQLVKTRTDIQVDTVFPMLYVASYNEPRAIIHASVIK